MKKSLIALAALAAVSAASAQSSVTLYGLVDIAYGAQSITSRDGTVSTRASGVQDGSQAGNRIGFRGTEDLGGGLKANFVVEQGISPTSGNVFSQRAAGPGIQQVGLAGGAFSTSTNRQSYLGLQSATLGTLNIGFTYTNAYELSTLSGYMVGSEQIGGITHLAGSNMALVGGTRANGLTYISPNFAGGFTVRAQYGAAGAKLQNFTSTATGGTGLTVDQDRRASLMLQYANGPLSAALAYTAMNSRQASPTGAVGATTNAFGVITAAGAPATLTGENRRANLTQLGASYDFGVAKLAGTYHRGNTGGTTTSTLNTRIRGYQIGVTAPFGAFAPFLMVGKENGKTDTVAADARDVRQTQLGVRYSLSKRTTAYVMYGRETDNSVVAAAAPGYRLTKTAVGVAHSF